MKPITLILVLLLHAQVYADFTDANFGILNTQSNPICYTTILDSICQGEDYVKNGFNIQQPALGTIRQTLYLPGQNNCDSTIYLILKVLTPTQTPTTITGDTSPCAGEETVYKADVPSYFHWILPDNAVRIGDRYDMEIIVYFRDDSPGNIILKGESGCSTGTISFQVNPRKSYDNQITDSICIGEAYNKYGFDLGKQDTIGLKTFVNEDKTTLGCDSITTLNLYVFSIPDVSIVVQSDSVICKNDTIELRAMAESLNFNNDRMIFVGDILCTDGSIVKPAEYAASGKKAEGIVFYVDETGEHGWVVSLENSIAALKYTFAKGIPASTPRYNYSDVPQKDMDGYSNTFNLRQEGVPVDYPAVWEADINNGWYIPAYGQLFMLNAFYYVVMQSLSITGGEPLYKAYGLPCTYFTSTVSSTGVYVGYSRNDILSITSQNTGAESHFRPIKNF